jgi:hypothetical protein
VAIDKECNVENRNEVIDIMLEALQGLKASQPEKKESGADDTAEVDQAQIKRRARDRVREGRRQGAIQLRQLFVHGRRMYAGNDEGEVDAAEEQERQRDRGSG